MTVVGEKLIVRPKSMDKTDAGIIIPENAQEVPFKGEVLGVGNVVPEGLEGLEIGDMATWMPYAGTWIKFNGIDALVIRFNDLIGYEKAEVLVS